MEQREIVVGDTVQWNEDKRVVKGIVREARTGYTFIIVKRHDYGSRVAMRRTSLQLCDPPPKANADAVQV